MIVFTGTRSVREQFLRRRHHAQDMLFQFQQNDSAFMFGLRVVVKVNSVLALLMHVMTFDAQEVRN